MTMISKSIAEWAADRPVWQQDVLSRLAAGQQIGPIQVVKIADDLAAGKDPGTRTLTEADVPSGGAEEQTVSLRSVGELNNVNALIQGDPLTFGAGGLTVVYGHNASGKSGYARLVKSAVGSLHSESVLGDVFAKGEGGPQKAQIGYMVDDDERTVGWPGPLPIELRAIDFYDQACGRAYIESETVAGYRPSALILLDQLIVVCDAVREQLNKRVAQNTLKKGSLPAAPEGSAAAQFISGVSETTTEAALDAASTPAPDDKERLAITIQEEARLRASDPGKEKARLTALAAELDGLVGELRKIDAALSAPAEARAISLREAAVIARQAAEAASATNFDGEPVAGVGSLAWRQMFEAARAFSEHDAYPERSFPFTEYGAHCPLCQQPLGGDGGGRLRRFDAFVRDTTSKKAEEAEAARVKAAAYLESLPIANAAQARTTASLAVHDADLGQRVSSYLTMAVARRDALVAAVNVATGPDPIALEVSPVDDIAAEVVKLRDEAAQIDSKSYAEALTSLDAEKRAIEGRQVLADHRPLIVAEIERLQERKSLDRALGLTVTTYASRLADNLTEKYVTDEVKDAFTRESERLDLHRIKLRKQAVEKGKVLHKPGLLGAEDEGAVREVLSEGEQTALGLAGFFTEASFDTSMSGLVLDDPVTSLDHERRDKVAKRLVQFASERQVIVFTHDLELVMSLSRESEGRKVELTGRSIARVGDKQPGLCKPELPWKAKDIGPRFSQLTEDLAALRKERDELDDEAYEKRVKVWSGSLSETWERILHLEIARPLFQPDGGEVHPAMLRVAAKVTDEDDQEFQESYKRISAWVGRHDTAPSSNYVAPKMEDLDAELASVQAWWKRVRKYSN